MDYAPVDINSIQMDAPPPDGYVPVDMSKITLDTPSLSEDIGNRLSQTALRSMQGQDTLPETILGVGGSIALPLVSKAGEILNSFMPSSAPTNSNTFGSNRGVVNQPATLGDFTSGTQNAISQTVTPVAQAFPRLARDVGNAAAISGLGSMTDVGLTAAGIAKDAAGNAIKPLSESIFPVVQNTADIAKTTDALQTAKTTAYNNAKTLGAVLTPAASDHVGISVPSYVENELGVKLDAGDTYSQTRQALSGLQRKTEQGLTTNDLEATRQRLNDVLNGSATGGDRKAAVLAKQAIDNIYGQIEQNPNMLVGGNPAAVQAFKDARYANGVYQNHKTIADIISDARSNPAKIQSALQKLTLSKNENDFNMFAPDEQNMIENIAFPNGVDTKLPDTGIIGKTIKGASVLTKGAIGAEAGSKLGFPIAGAIIGTGKGAWDVLSDAAKQAKILKGADNLQKLIASRAKPIETPESAAFRAKLNGVKQ